MTATRIACTLPLGALRDRTAWIGTLNRTWLRAVERAPGRATLTYDATAEAELQKLLRLESACCAFLTFQLTPMPPDAIALRIGAPDVEGAEHLLAPFLSGAPETGQ